MSLMNAQPASVASSSRHGRQEAEVPGQTSAERNGGFKVFASDIDTAVLNTAARGIYSETALESVDPQLQKTFFLRGKGEMLGQVRVKNEIIRKVQFEQINLMDNVWPIDVLFDAIFFRNALIYFKQETQDIFLRKMLRHLKPNGYLFLGHSENILWLHDVVAPLKNTIYQLRGTGH
jgi:chemotaxis protein methyltransferase CheR